MRTWQKLSSLNDIIFVKYRFQRFFRRDGRAPGAMIGALRHGNSTIEYHTRLEFVQNELAVRERPFNPEKLPSAGRSLRADVDSLRNGSRGEADCRGRDPRRVGGIRDGTAPVGRPSSTMAQIELSDPRNGVCFVKTAFRAVLMALAGLGADAAEPAGRTPLSNLYLWCRPQDMAFEKPCGQSARKRHHVRFWCSERGLGGRPIWLGSDTFNVGVGRSSRTGLVTHYIDPDVDRERDQMMGDLRQAGVLAESFLVPRFGPTQARNGGGDCYFTDGTWRWGFYS